VALLIEANITNGHSYFSAVAIFNATIGDAGAIDGSAEGVALVTSAYVSYPCLQPYEATGSFYANLPSVGFTLSATADVQLACDQTSPGVSSYSVISVPSLTFAGVSFTECLATLETGTYLEAAGSSSLSTRNSSSTVRDYHYLTLSGNADLFGLGLALSLKVNRTYHHTVFEATAFVDAVLGDAGAIDGSGEGVALVVTANLSYPCTTSIRSDGKLYIYLPSVGLELTMEAFIELFCDAQVPGTTSFATASLPSLTVAGLHFTNIGANITSGTVLDGSGKVQRFNNISIFGELTMYGIDLRLVVYLSKVGSSTDLSVFVEMSYVVSIMGQGQLALDGIVLLQHMGQPDASYSGSSRVALTGLPMGMPDIILNGTLYASANFRTWSLTQTLMVDVSVAIGGGVQLTLGSPTLSMSYDKKLAQYLNVSLSLPFSGGNLFVATSLPYQKTTGVTFGGFWPSVSTHDFATALFSVIGGGSNPLSAIVPIPGFDAFINEVLPTFTDLSLSLTIGSTPTFTAMGAAHVFGVQVDGMLTIFRTSGKWKVLSTIHASMGSFLSMQFSPSFLNVAFELVLGVFETFLDSVTFVFSSALITDHRVIASVKPHINGA
jgi:hypothetical protein